MSSCSGSKLLCQQRAACDQGPRGVRRAWGASTESDRAAGREMPDDRSVTGQAAAGIIGISFSPCSFCGFKKALSTYCIRLLVIFKHTTPVLGKAVM